MVKAVRKLCRSAGFRYLSAGKRKTSQTMEYEEKKKSPLASPVGTEREDADRVAALRRASDKDVEDAWEEAADAEYRASSEALAGLTSWAERALSASGLERRTGRKASAVAFFGADGRIAVSLHMLGVESPATLSFGFPKPGKNGFFRDDSEFRGRLGELPRRSAGTESERKAERGCSGATRSAGPPRCTLGSRASELGMRSTCAGRKRREGTGRAIR